MVLVTQHRSLSINTASIFTACLGQNVSRTMIALSRRNEEPWGHVPAFKRSNQFPLTTATLLLQRLKLNSVFPEPNRKRKDGS